MRDPTRPSLIIIQTRACIKNNLHVSHYPINTHYKYYSNQIQPLNLYKFQSNSNTKYKNLRKTLVSFRLFCLFGPVFFHPLLYPCFLLQSAIFLASLLIKFPSGKTILCDVIRGGSKRWTFSETMDFFRQS